MRFKNNIANIVIGSIAVYLVVLFTLSVRIAGKSESNPVSVSREVIVVYALRYLTDEELIKIGTKLDCSAYTTAVYKNFGLHIPRSSKQQFNNFLIQTEKHNPADLVFFKDDKNTIKHVGIILSDSTFIHSPGRNKPVRIDNLQSTYWTKYYAGTGSVLRSE